MLRSIFRVELELNFWTKTLAFLCAELGEAVVEAQAAFCRHGCSDLPWPGVRLDQFHSPNPLLHFPKTAPPPIFVFFYFCFHRYLSQYCEASAMTVFKSWCFGRGRWQGAGGNIFLPIVALLTVPYP